MTMSPEEINKIRQKAQEEFAKLYHDNQIEESVRMYKAPEGVKNDSGKPDLSLVPRTAIEGMARAFMIGEKKYGRNNFKQGMDSHRFIGAAMRHIVAWNDGEDLDPETANHHLWHALASLAMLLECERLGTLKDTRFKPKT